MAMAMAMIMIMIMANALALALALAMAKSDRPRVSYLGAEHPFGRDITIAAIVILPRQAGVCAGRSRGAATFREPSTQRV